MLSTNCLEDWSDVPQNVLSLLAQKVKDIADFLRFRAVCKRWRSPVLITDLSLQFPWVFKHRNSPYEEQLLFYSIPSKKLHSIVAPEASGKRLFGSSRGYMIAQNTQLGMGSSGQRIGRLSLYNPLINDVIPLPEYNIDCYPHQSGPLQTQVGEDYVVQFGPLGDCISILPLNDVVQHIWEEIVLGMNYVSLHHFCCGDMLFSVERETGVTRATDLTTGTLAYVIEKVEGFEQREGTEHILKAFDEIFRVFQPAGRLVFDIHQLDVGSRSWIRTNNIGNKSLFIDTKGGFAVEANEHLGINGNSIYYMEPGSDVMILNLETGHREFIQCPWEEPGYWFMPNLQRLQNQMML